MNRTYFGLVGAPWKFRVFGVSISGIVVLVLPPILQGVVVGQVTGSLVQNPKATYAS